MPQTGMEQFLNLFGNFTVADVIKFVLAVIFCIMLYNKFKSYLIEKIKTEQEHEKKIEETLKQIPEYRQQNIEIQNHFQEEIDVLKQTQEVLAAAQQEMCASLKDMQAVQEKRDRNRIRDRLLQSYRYYTNLETNPNQCISRMESEAFWELFGDYEEAGGDGFMHTVVQPAMNLLKITDN